MVFCKRLATVTSLTILSVASFIITVSEAEGEALKLTADFIILPAPSYSTPISEKYKVLSPDPVVLCSICAIPLSVFGIIDAQLPSPLKKLVILGVPLAAKFADKVPLSVIGSKGSFSLVVKFIRLPELRTPMLLTVPAEAAGPSIVSTLPCSEVVIPPVVPPFIWIVEPSATVVTADPCPCMLQENWVGIVTESKEPSPFTNSVSLPRHSSVNVPFEVSVLETPNDAVLLVVAAIELIEPTGVEKLPDPSKYLEVPGVPTIPTLKVSEPSIGFGPPPAIVTWKPGIPELTFRPTLDTPPPPLVEYTGIFSAPVAELNVAAPLVPFTLNDIAVCLASNSANLVELRYPLVVLLASVIPIIGADGVELSIVIGSVFEILETPAPAAGSVYVAVL